MIDFYTPGKSIAIMEPASASKGRARPVMSDHKSKGLPAGGIDYKYDIVHDNDHYFPPPLSGSPKGAVITAGCFHVQ